MNTRNWKQTNANRSVAWGLLAAAAVAAAGCDARWHLIGESPRVPSSTGAGGGAAGPGAAGEAPPSMPAPRPLGTAAVDAVTRLSWLLWQSAPDPALLARAQSGMLTTSEDVRQLALQMQQDPRARLGVQAFYRWWLELDRMAGVQKDPLLFPTFNAALASDMAAETETFATSVTLDMNGSFAQLLTAPFSYLNESLAAVYGVSGISGSGLRLTQLPLDKRAGLFTQPSFLTMHAHETEGSPAERGLFITSRLFCSPVPPPPPAVNMTLPTIANATLRQRMEAATAGNPACAACHNQLDGIGYAFEHYDAIGQYRTVDNGLPIDASIHINRGNLLVVDGAVELAAALAHDPGAERCMSRNWLTYALGRSLTMADEPTVTEVNQWFTLSDFKLQAVIAAAMQTDAFLRSPPICTPGADQTCNDDPQLSRVQGLCTPASRCVCKSGSPNPETGRCP